MCLDLSKAPANVYTAGNYPQGYPRLAAYTAFDEDLLVFRSFKHIHTRLILRLQADIQSLERELIDIDDADAADVASALRLKSREVDFSHCKEREAQKLRSRDQILDDLQVKIDKYGK